MLQRFLSSFLIIMINFCAHGENRVLYLQEDNLLDAVAAIEDYGSSVSELQVFVVFKLRIHK